MPMKSMKVEDLHVTPLLQSRSGGVCKATVAEYANAIKGGAKFPPIIVYTITDRSFKKPSVVSGFHRIEAYKAAGVESVEVDARTGTYAEAWLASWLSNLTHGLRYSNADKRAAVEKALKLYKGDSAAVIAERISVSDEFVRKVKREMVSVGEIEDDEKVKRKDGSYYPAKIKSDDNKNGCPTVGHQEEKPLENSDSEDTPVQDLTEPKAAPEPVNQPAAAESASDTPVQQELSKEIEAVCRELDKLKAIVESWKERPESYSIHFPTVADGLFRIRQDLWAMRLSHPCPYCETNAKPDCKACRGTRKVTKASHTQGARSMNRYGGVA